MLPRLTAVGSFSLPRSILSLSLLVAVTAVSSFASVREDQRACQYGFLKTLKKGAPPPRTENPDEQYCLGLAYWFQPSPLPRDPARAAEWYEAAAKQGHVGAMVLLAYQYEKGQGLEVNVGKAFDLYQRAAERGSSDAMFNVFRLYTTGKGVKADSEQARKWLEKAAAAGSIDAKKELMQTARGTYQRPRQDIENAAYPAFTKKDYATSARLYRQASDLGNMAATVALGQHYHQGLGIKQDDAEAARLFRIAAERGDPAGQAQLGLAHEHGEGVPENWEAMRSWCEESACQFHPLGLNCAGRLFQFGMAVPMDRAKAIALYDKAADQDDRYARWFAYYLRKSQNCIGYRSEWEREKFFGLCLEPKGIVFKTSKERTAWLRQRYNEMEAEVLRNWGNSGGSVCTGAGGSWSGVSCYTPSGRPFDPTQGRAN
jgi:TPR repeat protein